MAKVYELNLERGFPSAESAIKIMVNQISTLKRQGYKAIIIIHGYGSTGTGGAIKSAVKRKLQDRAMSGLVRCHCGGEEWNIKSNEILQACGSLSDYRTSIAGNQGKTVVVLK